MDLSDLQGRLARSRNHEALVASLINDHGGSRVSEIHLHLIRRFAGCVLVAEQIEARIKQGDQIEIGQYANLCNTLVRIADSIGLQKTPQHPMQSLVSYLRSE